MGYEIWDQFKRIKCAVKVLQSCSRERKWKEFWEERRGDLHHKSFQGHSFKVVRVLVVELEVVVEDEGGLHVQRHLKPDRGSSCKLSDGRVVGMRSSHLSGPWT